MIVWSTWRDQGWLNTRRVREERALRIQNGGLTTQHDTDKHRESFLIWHTFDRNFNLQRGKSSINFIWFYGFFFMIRDDPRRSELLRVDPTRTGGPSWSGPTFVPAFGKTRLCHIGKGARMRHKKKKDISENFSPTPSPIQNISALVKI